MTKRLETLLGKLGLNNRPIVAGVTGDGRQTQLEHFLRSAQSAVAVRLRADICTDDLPVMSSEVRDLILDRLIDFRTTGQLVCATRKRDCPIENRKVVEEAVTFYRDNNEPKILGGRVALLLLDNTCYRYFLEEVDMDFGVQVAPAPHVNATAVGKTLVANAQAGAEVAELLKQMRELKAENERLKLSSAPTVPDEGEPAPSDKPAEPEKPAPEAPTVPGAPPPPRASKAAK